MNKYALLALAVAIPSFGFTDCTNFSDVTVPSTDTTSPEFVGTNIFSVPSGGSYVQGIHIGFFGFTTTLYNGSWGLAPFGTDSGGLQKIKVDKTIRKQCSGVWTTVENTTLIDEDTVSGPGDTVSNGRYLVITFRPSDHGASSCKRIELSYDITVWDFAGNASGTAFELKYLKPS